MARLAGFKHSKAAKEKMRLSRLGKKLPKDVIAKIVLKTTGKKRTAAQKEYMRMVQTGRPHPNALGSKNHRWKGGITPLNYKIRHSLEYKLWRKAVFERDGYQCIWGAGKHGKYIQADHIKPFTLYPELRFAIDNGRTLCIDCHKKTDTYGSKLKKTIYSSQLQRE